MFRRLFSGFLVFVAASAVASEQFPSARLRQIPLAQREYQSWTIPLRASEFSDVPHLSLHSRCENTKAPQPLATPRPLLVPMGSTQNTMKVSFIVGSDGRVHSPLILESAGTAEDRSILRTVRDWRYRPATCNGVPIEAEGKMEFSRR